MSIAPDHLAANLDAGYQGRLGMRRSTVNAGRPVPIAVAVALRQPVRRALAVLEVRVHFDLPLDLLPDDYVLMKIGAPDHLEVQAVASDQLPRGWRSREDVCRTIGDASSRRARRRS